MAIRAWFYACASTAAFIASQAAWAQPAAEGEVVTEEVIVTARRREENIQDVPISITALSGEQLEARGITSVTQLAQKVPALSVAGSSIARDSLAYGIRGQRNQEVQYLSDPSVGTYFAEVVIPRTPGFNYQVFDLQSVQVLKGVQGTLFGRNMTGGAVLLEPARPTYEWGGSLKGTAGNYSMWGAEGVLNIPIVEDKVAARLAARIERRSGFTEEVLTGRKWDNKANEAYRGSVLLNPTDDLESLFIYDYLHSHTDGTSAVLIQMNVPSTAGSIPAGEGPNSLSSAAYAQQQFALNRTCNFRCIVGSELSLGNNAPNLGREQPNPGQTAFDAIRMWGVTNKTTWDVGDITVVNIAGFRFLDFNRLQDFDGIPRAMITSTQFTHGRHWSEELRANGKAFDDRLDWTTGIYYFREMGRDGSISQQFTAYAANPVTAVPPGFAIPIVSLGNQGYADTVATSYAIYGAGEFKLTDRWSLAGGLRWNHDQREIHQFSRGNQGIGICRFASNATPNVAGSLNLADPCVLTNGNTYRQVTWDITLKWKPDPDTTIYGAQRKGYRSGGFSLRANTLATLAPFAPELVKETEFGAKKQWDLNGTRITTNGALFYQNYTNIQTQNPTVVGGQVQTIVVNTAKQKNFGGELEVNMLFPWGLDVGAYYSRVSIADRIGDNGSTPYRGIPKHKLGLNAAYTFPFDESVGQVVLSGDVSYQSHMPLDDFDSVSDMDGYALTNFRLDWSDVMGSGIGAALFVNNALDKTYFVSTVALIREVGEASNIVGEPRMWGGELRYKF